MVSTAKSGMPCAWAVIAMRAGFGHARHQRVNQPVHRRRVERVEGERRPVAPGTPARSRCGQLGPGENEDVQGDVTRPVGQVVEEVQQAGVGVLRVFDEEDDRRADGEPLEEQPPAGEQFLAVKDRFAWPGIGHAQQSGQPDFHVTALCGVREVGRQAVLEFGGRDRDGIVLRDGQSLPHDLGQGPEGDPVAVGQAAAAMPPHGLGQAVDVLLELPAEPGLADAGRSAHHHHPRRPALGGGVEELLHRAQLGVATEQGRLEPVDPLGTADAGQHPGRHPQVHRLGLALERVPTGVGEADGRAGEAVCRVVDPHLAGSGGGLHPSGGVHRIACDTLTDQPDGHCDLAGHDAGPRLEVRRADLVAEQSDGGDEIETGPHRPLRIALDRDRRPPDRHDGIADELLHHAAVAPDDRAGDVEVAGQEFAHLLGVPGLRQRGEADQVDEQHRTDPPLSGRWCGSLAGRTAVRRGQIRPRTVGLQRTAAATAEAILRLVRGAAGRTGGGQRGSACGAEPSSGPVRSATGEALVHVDPPESGRQRLTTTASRRMLYAVCGSAGGNRRLRAHRRAVGPGQTG